jgi:hypothetical protein
LSGFLANFYSKPKIDHPTADPEADRFDCRKSGDHPTGCRTVKSSLADRPRLGKPSAQVHWFASNLDL